MRGLTDEKIDEIFWDYNHKYGCGPGHEVRALARAIEKAVRDDTCKQTPQLSARGTAFTSFECIDNGGSRIQKYCPYCGRLIKWRRGQC